MPQSPLGFSYDENDVTRLTEAMLGEARGQGAEGMAAVGASILNRTIDGRYGGHTVTGVIDHNRDYSYRFDNNLREALREMDNNTPVSQQAAMIARGLLEGSIPDPTNGATSYHGRGAVISNWQERGMANGYVTIGGQHFYDASPNAEARARIQTAWANTQNPVNRAIAAIGGFIQNPLAVFGPGQPNTAAPQPNVPTPPRNPLNPDMSYDPLSSVSPPAAPALDVDFNHAFNETEKARQAAQIKAPRIGRDANAGAVPESTHEIPGPFPGQTFTMPNSNPDPGFGPFGGGIASVAGVVRTMLGYNDKPQDTPNPMAMQGPDLASAEAFGPGGKFFKETLDRAKAADAQKAIVGRDAYDSPGTRFLEKQTGVKVGTIDMDYDTNFANPAMGVPSVADLGMGRGSVANEAMRQQQVGMQGIAAPSFQRTSMAGDLSLGTVTPGDWSRFDGAAQISAPTPEAVAPSAPGSLPNQRLSSLPSAQAKPQMVAPTPTAAMLSPSYGAMPAQPPQTTAFTNSPMPAPAPTVAAAPPAPPPAPTPPSAPSFSLADPGQALGTTFGMLSDPSQSLQYSAATIAPSAIEDQQASVPSLMSPEFSTAVPQKMVTDRPLPSVAPPTVAPEEQAPAPAPARRPAQPITASPQPAFDPQNFDDRNVYDENGNVVGTINDDGTVSKPASGLIGSMLKPGMLGGAVAGLPGAILGATFGWANNRPGGLFGAPQSKATPEVADLSDVIGANGKTGRQRVDNGVLAQVNALNLGKAPEGYKYGWSPFDRGVALVSNRAPEGIKIAASGSGIFGALGLADNTGYTGPTSARGFLSSLFGGGGDASRAGVGFSPSYGAQYGGTGTRGFGKEDTDRSGDQMGDRGGVTTGTGGLY